jgi:hypothetical protein
MSVIPLSVAERDGLIQSTSAGREVDVEADNYQADQKAAESKAFDRHFERAYAGAIDELERGQQTPRRSRKSLDDQLTDAMEPFSRDIETGVPLKAIKSDDAHEFDASKEARAELEHRYSEAGDFGQTLGRFLHMAGMLRANPTMAAEQIATSYMRASPWGMTPRKPDEYVGPDWKNATPLDKIIRDAQSAGKDAKDFQATTAHREALRQVFPTMTFDQALSEVVRIDTLLRKDPLAGAASLGAAFGMPITANQEREAQEDAQIAQAIQHGDQTIPALRHPQVRQVAARQVLMSPYFEATGDHVRDLGRAATIAQNIIRQGVQDNFDIVNDARFNPYRTGNLNADLQRAGQMLREQHAATQAAIPGQIAAFERKFPDLPIYRTDMAVLLASGQATDLPSAYRMAKQQRQEHAAAVSRAKAARPVRGSAGLSPSRGDNSLDGIIGNALDRAGM